MLIAKSSFLTTKSYNHHLSMRTVDPFELFSGWAPLPGNDLRQIIEPRGLWIHHGHLTQGPGLEKMMESHGNPTRSLESLGKSQVKCDDIHNIYIIYKYIYIFIFFYCEPFVWQNWQNTWNLDGIFLSMENTKARLVWVVWTATLLLKHNATATGMENYNHITVAKLTWLCGMLGNDRISLWSHAIKWRKFDQQTSVSQAVRIFAHQLMVLDIIKWDLYIYIIIYIYTI